MDNARPIYADCQELDRLHQMLSIYNMHLADFLRLFKDNKIIHFSLYWIDGDKDFVTSSTCSLPIFDLNFLLHGVDVEVCSVELGLDNDFLIDSNIVDEIFCRVPAGFNVQPLMGEINQGRAHKKISQHPLSRISLLDQDTWNTKETVH